MRKHIFGLLLIVLTIPIGSHSQPNMQDVLYLTDGSIYRGTIVKQIPDSICMIQISGGSVVVIHVQEIQRITKEKNPLDVIADSLYYLKVERRRQNRSFGFETGLSGILLFNGQLPYTNKENISSGGGISLLPEYRKNKHFSILFGVAFQYILTSNFINYTDAIGDYTSIDKGYQIRFEIPLWFRWTYGQKVPFLFQLGWGIGGDFYQGWGNQATGGGSMYAPPLSYGWQRTNMGFMDILAVGFGIRKEINPGVEIVTYIQGSPLNIPFASSDYGTPYLIPYLQYNFCINFNQKHKDQAKKK